MDMGNEEGIDCGLEGWAGWRGTKGNKIWDNCNRINKNKKKRADEAEVKGDMVNDPEMHFPRSCSCEFWTHCVRQL